MARTRPQLAELLAAWGMDAKVVSDQLGVASAIKMCRSVMIKGLEALVIESYTTARAYGVEDHVIPTLQETFPSIDWQHVNRLTGGKAVMVYGQTEVTADLYTARDDRNGIIHDEVAGVMPHDLDGDAPYVTYLKDGKVHRIDCDFVAGRDGFHGVSRTMIPTDTLREYEGSTPSAGWAC